LEVIQAEEMQKEGDPQFFLIVMTKKGLEYLYAVLIPAKSMRTRVFELYLAQN